MAEVEYVSMAQFEAYKKSVNRQFEHTSNLAAQRCSDLDANLRSLLDQRLANLKVELKYEAWKKVLGTLSCLALVAVIGAFVVSLLRGTT